MSEPNFVPKPETLALLREPGNPINGLGETAERRPSPFFWHPPDKHPFGDLQAEARKYSRRCPGAAEEFRAAYQHPALVPIASVRTEGSVEALSMAMHAHALANESDMVGVAAMNPLWTTENCVHP